MPMGIDDPYIQHLQGQLSTYDVGSPSHTRISEQIEFWQTNTISPGDVGDYMVRKLDGGLIRSGELGAAGVADIWQGRYANWLASQASVPADQSGDLQNGGIPPIAIILILGLLLMGGI